MAQGGPRAPGFLRPGWRWCVPAPGSLEGVSLHPFVPAQGASSTMKGSRASGGPSGPAEGGLERVDLRLTGLPPPVSRRPSSASVAKPLTRSISVVAGSEPRRKAPVSARARGVWGCLGPCLPGRRHRGGM